MAVAHWHFEIIPLTALDEVGAQWLQLEEKSDCSFFQSWHWVESWLRTLPDSFEPLLLRLSAEDDVVALAVVIQTEQSRHRVIRSRCLYFGETGKDECDAITVEYGGPLISAKYLHDAARFTIERLRRAKLAWDELYLPGLDETAMRYWLAAAEDAGLIVRMADQKPYFAVDLKGLSDFEDYLARLSSNTRQQIRRAIRGYEKSGPIEITEAASKGEVTKFFSELRRLHQAYWQEKGFRGAFSSGFQNGFHDLLIKKITASNHLQLLRVRCGDCDIGYLYNFVWRGSVYSYQSGFRYSNDDARLKPGLVCHSLAVDFNREGGVSTYDFLAGDSRYKRSLSTKTGTMSWPVLQRPRLRFKMENQLSHIWRKVQTRT